RACACADWVTDCTVSAMRWTAEVTPRLPRACSTVARAMAFTITVLRFAVALIRLSAVSASRPSSTPSCTCPTPSSPPPTPRPPRVPALVLDPGDGRGDLLGGGAGALGELLDLVRHHREALSLLAGLGGDDRRVQREEVGLLGDLVDDVEDGDHLADAAPEAL